ncbi:MAG: hypothetical protein Q8M53_14160 [Burkholderiales bacterium]|nr:hypothetical protein [Burkholderiales bacterium]
MFWVLRNFLLFLVIVGILVAAGLLQKKFTEWASQTAELSRLEAEQRDVENWQLKEKADLSSRVAQLRNIPASALSARVKSLSKEIEGKELEQQMLGGLPSLVMGGAIGSGIATRLKLGLEIELLKQERDHIAYLLSAIKAPENLEELRKKHVLAYALLELNEATQKHLKASHPFKVYMPATAQFNQLRELKAAHKRLDLDNRIAHENYTRQADQVKSIKDSPQTFRIREDRIDDIVRPLNSAIDKRRKFVSDHWFSKFSQPISNVLPIALLVLLAVILTPVAIKALFYFVFAPLASRRPPICILPGVSGEVSPQTEGADSSPDQARFTSVSQRLNLAPDEELLIHPEYLQSSSRESKTDTRWLLDWSLPLSSLASGMVALIRIRCEETATIVISPRRDALSEVGVLDLPEGSAVVFQPRSLVGVVYRSDAPLRITRHWRLASWHAWLTLQLRYLVFHGPAKLVVKGCRGARIEAAQTGRRINQAGTMGFSANLMYSTTRCETFVSYLMGEQELLNDSFTGAPGFYVYEETPNFGRRTGLTGRGLEGVFDSFLKAFGL